jgi:hypothetical protein
LPLLLRRHGVDRVPVVVNPGKEVARLFKVYVLSAVDVKTAAALQNQSAHGEQVLFTHFFSRTTKAN